MRHRNQHMFLLGFFDFSFLSVDYFDFGKCNISHSTIGVMIFQMVDGLKIYINLPELFFHHFFALNLKYLSHSFSTSPHTETISNVSYLCKTIKHYNRQQGYCTYRQEHSTACLSISILSIALEQITFDRRFTSSASLSVSVFHIVGSSISKPISDEI